jgi:hypothetical protein
MAVRRVAAAGGASAVALWVLASLTARLPGSDSTAAEVADYFDDEHVAVVSSVYLEGLAIACFLFFIGGAATVVRQAGEAWLAAAALAAGAIFAGLLGLASVVLAALAYRATDDGSVAQSLFDVALLGLGFSSFPAAALIGALGVAALKTAVFPRWYGVASIGTVLVVLVAGATYAGSGFFSPQAGYADLASVLFGAWVLTTSAYIVQVPDTSEPRHGTCR